MITSIELENFKAFGRRVTIPLAPITLIFGENSSGKSSILQSLNLLKQTRESREAGIPLLPRSEHGISDLGSFQDILFDHDVSRPLSIQVGMNVSRPLQRPAYWSRSLSRNDLSGLAVELTFRRPSLDEEVLLHEMKILSSETRELLAGFQPIRTKEVPRQVMRDIRERFRLDRGLLMAKDSDLQIAKCTHITKNPKYWTRFFENARKARRTILKNLAERVSPWRDARIPFDLEENQAPLSDDEGDSSRDRKKKLAIEEAREFWTSDFSLDAYVERMVKQQLGTVIGLDGFLPFGAARMQETPAEDYAISFSRTLPEIRFDTSWLALFAGRLLEQTLEDLFPLGPYRRPPERWYIFPGTSPQDVGYKGEQLPDLLFRNPDLVEEANHWLERLDIGYRLKINSLGQSLKDLFEVRLEDTRRHQPVVVGLSDVGFGISQLLPFVVQSLASERKIISIEQPEVHIHPKLQANLGNLLARAIEEPRYNQFIIETHSEHLVLRLQKLVREGHLKPSDLSVIYVSRGIAGSTVQSLRIDEEGDFIDDWPGGFFPERLHELS
jgi:hypothetical protein